MVWFMRLSIPCLSGFLLSLALQATNALTLPKRGQARLNNVYFLREIFGSPILSLYTSYLLSSTTNSVHFSPSLMKNGIHTTKDAFLLAWHHNLTWKECMYINLPSLNQMDFDSCPYIQWMEAVTSSNCNPVYFPHSIFLQPHMHVAKFNPSYRVCH